MLPEGNVIMAGVAGFSWVERGPRSARDTSTLPATGRTACNFPTGGALLTNSSYPDKSTKSLAGFLMTPQAAEATLKLIRLLQLQGGLPSAVDFNA